MAWHAYESASPTAKSLNPEDQNAPVRRLCRFRVVGTYAIQALAAFGPKDRRNGGARFRAESGEASGHGVGI